MAVHESRGDGDGFTRGAAGVLQRPAGRVECGPGVAQQQPKKQANMCM